MGKIRIVTDSSAQFVNPEIVKRYNIEVVPNTVHLGAQSFREGVDLDTEAFFRLQNQSNAPITLSAPSVDAFTAVYGRLNRSTDKVLSLHMSRAFGATWNNARTATKTLLGRCEIVVLDSLTTSVGLGMLVEAAARAVEDGLDIDEVVRIVRGMVAHIYIVVYVESLEYLRRNGLLSESQSVLGAMLNIKPFLTIEEGEIIPMEKVRTDAQAVDKLVEFVTEFSNVNDLVILQNTPYATDTIRALQEQLGGEFPGRSFPSTMYGPSLAALIGLDATGLVVYEGDEDEDVF
ncbi:DegV family protein [Aggregatilinea lenta]|uniref:DegV family protein n=1 Tax=Aggregatilinea lenta TaxID=913108 RepID=UPI000E5A8841|nr:DegV family protein [Aggregatilinea lenta]